MPANQESVTQIIHMLKMFVTGTKNGLVLPCGIPAQDFMSPENLKCWVESWSFKAKSPLGIVFQDLQRRVAAEEAIAAKFRDFVAHHFVEKAIEQFQTPTMTKEEAYHKFANEIQRFVNGEAVANPLLLNLDRVDVSQSVESPTTQLGRAARNMSLNEGGASTSSSVKPSRTQQYVFGESFSNMIDKVSSKQAADQIESQRQEALKQELRANGRQNSFIFLCTDRSCARNRLKKTMRELSESWEIIIESTSDNASFRERTVCKGCKTPIENTTLSIRICTNVNCPSFDELYAKYNSNCVEPNISAKGHTASWICHTCGSDTGHLQEKDLRSNATQEGAPSAQCLRSTVPKECVHVEAIAYSASRAERTHAANSSHSNESRLLHTIFASIESVIHQCIPEEYKNPDLVDELKTLFEQKMIDKVMETLNFIEDESHTFGPAAVGTVGWDHTHHWIHQHLSIALKYICLNYLYFLINETIQNQPSLVLNKLTKTQISSKLFFQAMLEMILAKHNHNVYAAPKSEECMSFCLTLMNSGKIQQQTTNSKRSFEEQAYTLRVPDKLPMGRANKIHTRFVLHLQDYAVDNPMFKTEIDEIDNGKELCAILVGSYDHVTQKLNEVLQSMGSQVLSVGHERFDSILLYEMYSYIKNTLIPETASTSSENKSARHQQNASPVPFRRSKSWDFTVGEARGFTQHMLKEIRPKMEPELFLSLAKELVDKHTEYTAT